MTKKDVCEAIVDVGSGHSGDINKWLNNSTFEDFVTTPQHRKVVFALNSEIARLKNEICVDRDDTERHLTKEHFNNLFFPKTKKKPLIRETEDRIVKKEYASDLALKPGKYVVREYARDKWYKTLKFFVKLYCLDDNKEYKARAGDKLAEEIDKALGSGEAQFIVDIKGSAYIKDDWKTKDLLFHVIDTRDTPRN